MADELVQLASIYAPPGFLLLATTADDPAERLGCIGARAIDDDTCEIRRLFVRDTGRRSGLGRQLAGQLLTLAQEAGFTRVVLNTLPAMTEAISLYESMGFERIEPYVDEPLDEVLYFALSLRL